MYNAHGYVLQTKTVKLLKIIYSKYYELFSHSIEHVHVAHHFLVYGQKIKKLLEFRSDTCI